MINSSFRTGWNYYPQVFLEECKCVVKEKKIPEYITGGIEISSDEENSYEENYSIYRMYFLREQFCKCVLWGDDFENVYFVWAIHWLFFRQLHSWLISSNCLNIYNNSLLCLFTKFFATSKKFMFLTCLNTSPELLIKLVTSNISVQAKVHV